MVRRTPWARRARISPVHAVALVAVVVYAIGLRACHLGTDPLWTDEAETSINALTVLERGFPAGEYLGQPVYENTLVEPWPDHPEYEFRDSSYSTRGLAIYHGWLPIYATALSFRLAGIEPDRAGPRPAPRTTAELHYRTAVARAPAVVFSVVFLVALFLAARHAYGIDAARAVVVAAAVSTSAILLGRQARYYSATLAMTALCTLLLARMVTRGQRRDFALGGPALALLFHTNLLAVVAMAAAFASSLPLLLRQSRLPAKLAMLGAGLAAGVLPWVLLTGFLDAATRLPPARALLGPEEVAGYLARRLPFVALAAVTLLWLAGIQRFRRRLPERLIRPFLHARPVFLVLAAWTTGAFAAFNLLVPAASYFHSRLSLILLVPALLFGGVLAAALSRTITHRHSPALATVLFVSLLAVSGKATLWPVPATDAVAPLFEVVSHLQTLPVRPDTRIYADTGTALPLTFYAGLPVQNVMPVRREFLDRHPGEVIVVEGPALSIFTGSEVRVRLAEAGIPVDEDEAGRLGRQARQYLVKDRLASRGAVVAGALPDEPAAVALLKPALVQQTVRDVAETIAVTGNPMFKGFDVQTYTEMWQVFFYRFVDPAARMREHVNYASRVRGAEATLLRGGWSVLRSAGRPAGQMAPARGEEPGVRWAP